MAATATAARTATPARRQAPGRRPATHRASASPTLRRARSTSSWLVPAAAVGRTAVAVGGLADSGLVVRLTRGRLWIGLLATLLVGIVGLNVVALSFTASSSKTGRAADELDRQNSALRAELASQLSSQQLQRTATRLGLIVPAPGAYAYIDPGADDAEVAAKRLRSGELTFTDAAAAVPDATAETAPPATEALVTGATAEPAVATEPEPTAAETSSAAAVAEPAAPAVASDPAGGVPAP